MSGLISCNSCKAVFENDFINCFRYSDFELKDFCNDSNKVLEFLKERPTRIVSYWSDIEQTEETFMKFCPVCKESRYFSEVKLHDNIQDS